MEKFPKSKVKEGSEESVEQRDLALKKRLEEMWVAKSSEEARVEEIKAWQTQEEKLVPKNSESEIGYLTRIAEMKLAAGFLNDAWNDYYDAINCANGHGRIDIADRIRERMRVVDQEYSNKEEKE